MFTKEELMAIGELISRATLQGKEAKPVSDLLEKIQKLILEQTEKPA